MSAKAKERATEGGHSCPPNGGLENPPSVGAAAALRETELGPLPNSWRVSALGEVAKIERGKFTHRPRNEPRFYGGSIPFVQTGDVTKSGGRIRTYSQTLNELGLTVSRTFPPGVILITIAANIGYSGILEFESACPDSLVGITPSKCVDTEYLQFYLGTQQPEMDRLAPRGTQKNINLQFLKPWPIILPPLAEQRKIAGVLGVVQRAMEQQERLLALTAELKKALLHQLFTAGLRGEPQKQTDLGPVPDSWEVAKLGDVFDTQLGKMLSQKAKTGNDPKPYLRNKNVQWGAIDTTDLLLMDFNERERAKFVLEPGDLLICEGGEPGRAAIWHGEMKECYYQKALHRLRPKSDNVSNEFLAHWLDFALRYQDIYGVAGASSTIAHLPEVQLKMLPIPLPSRNEQDTMVESINAVDNKISLHQRKHAALTALFRTLLHQLMTAQIRMHDLSLDDL